jgi:hypothetical protein
MQFAISSSVARRKPTPSRQTPMYSSATCTKGSPCFGPRRAAYCKLLTLLCPRDVKVEHSGGVKAMSDEEIEQAIELIKAMIAERDAGANAKVIEGEAEVVPSLPAPGSGGTKMPKV